MSEDTTPSDALKAAAGERQATKMELDAAIMVFEANLRRNDTARLTAAAESARAALDAHLDSISGFWAIAKRDHG